MLSFIEAFGFFSWLICETSLETATIFAFLASFFDISPTLPFMTIALVMINNKQHAFLKIIKFTGKRSGAKVVSGQRRQLHLFYDKVRYNFNTTLYAYKFQNNFTSIIKIIILQLTKK